MWVNDDIIPTNYVVMTNPPSGTRAEIGTTVTVYVSLGASSKPVFVPNFVGLTEDEAYTEAYNNSLIPVFEYAPCEDGSIEKGRVMKQSINFYEKVDEGTSITLTISNGSSNKTVEICGYTVDVNTEEYFSLSDKNLSKEDLENLGKLENLTELILINCGISDLTQIAKLKNLKILNLAWNNINDLTPLESMTNLTYLALTSNNISDISSLKNLTNLTNLSINNNNITDITPVTNLKSLKEFEFDRGDMTIEDIKWLGEQLPNCRFYY